MKKLLTLIALIFTLSLSAQVEIIPIVTGENPTWDISKVTDTDGKKYIFFYCTFEDLGNYGDNGSIASMSKSDMQLLVVTLRRLANYDKGTLIQKIARFQVTKYNFSELIVITDKDGRYTAITKEQAIVFANELEKNINLFIR